MSKLVISKSINKYLFHEYVFLLEDCRNVQCPTNKICLLVKNTGEPMCYPRNYCDASLDPEPVCGTNGRTYPNICAMRLSVNRYGRTPELAHKGPCGNVIVIISFR